MKNTVVAISICLFPCAVWAQSTCETRVDAHQRATTSQRVAYCLMPDSQDPAHNPGLVFSGVSSPHPEEPYHPEKATSKGGNFKADRMVVSKEFVETNRFPKLSDGRVSRQEVLQQQAALQEGKQTAVAQSKRVLREEPVQTIAGVWARRAKPGRQMKQTNEKPQASAAAKRNTKPKKTMETTDDLETDKELAPVPSKPLAYSQEEPEAVSQTGLDALADDGYEIMNEEEIPVGTASYAPAK